MKILNKVLFAILLVQLNAYSQPLKINLPQILPPTPEAAAITKNAELNVGLFNGAMQATVPIRTIKVGAFSFPISINYASNGFKVDELPSRVGIGWNLSAGGAVTRIVQGAPDDLAQKLTPPATLGTDLTALTYYKNMTMNSSAYDSEPDEFRVAGPGFSFKFVIDDSGSPILIPFSNIKVQVNRFSPGGPFHEVVITNTDGIKYFFGGLNAIETTTNHSIGGKLSGFSQINTGFFLRKIQLINNDSINFYYSLKAIRLISGITHTATVANGVAIGTNNCTPGGCPVGNLTFNESVSDIHYNSCLLDSINSINGDRVIFSYENRPDNGGDKRLSNISIPIGERIFNYSFIYEDPTPMENTGHVMGDYNKRFFLKKLLSQAFLSGIGSEIQKHSFDYNDLENLPRRLSYSQDHYGYFNGKGNATLLPKGYGGNNYGNYGPYALADREPDGAYAAMGLLSQIHYPTGGKEVISYGSNKYSTAIKLKYTASQELYGAGTGQSGISTYFTPLFTVQRTHQSNLTISAFINSFCIECLPLDPGIDRIVDVYIRNLTDGTFNRRILTDYSQINEDYTLLAGKTYMIEMRVKGDYTEGSVCLEYDKEAQDTYVITWLNGPGVHVDSIVSFDGMGNIGSSKYYKYVKLDSLKTSSMLELYGINYSGLAYKHTVCTEVDPNALLGDYQVCKFDVLTSNSNAYQYFYDSNPVVYSSVIESDRRDWSNGFTEHLFMAEAFSYGFSVLGDENFNLPSNTNTWYNGYELATRDYNNNYELVKYKENFYSLDSAFKRSLNGIVVRAKYELDLPLPEEGIFLEDYYPYDVSMYTYESKWIKLDSILTKDFDGNIAIDLSKRFYYGDTSNINIKIEESLNSKGMMERNYFSYPTDFIQTSGVYSEMANRNMISFPIEILKKGGTNNKLLESVRNSYNFFNGTLLLCPSAIEKAFGTNPYKTEVTFDRYDYKGNLLQYKTVDGVAHSYLWSYNNSLPVAEVIGLDYLTLAGLVDYNSLGLLQNSSQIQTALQPLKLYPAFKGKMLTHIPRIGIETISDSNGNDTFYQYDAFGRLIFIKDKYGNIIKSIEYKYGTY